MVCSLCWWCFWLGWVIPKTNQEMCEIVTLRREKRELMERVGELEKMLSRAAREIETLCSQYDYAGSTHLLDKIQSVLINKAP